MGSHVTQQEASCPQWETDAILVSLNSFPQGTFGRKGCGILNWPGTQVVLLGVANGSTLTGDSISDGCSCCGVQGTTGCLLAGIVGF